MTHLRTLTALTTATALMLTPVLPSLPGIGPSVAEAKDKGPKHKGHGKAKAKGHGKAQKMWKGQNITASIRDAMPDPAPRRSSDGLDLTTAAAILGGIAALDTILSDRSAPQPAYAPSTPADRTAYADPAPTVPLSVKRPEVRPDDLALATTQPTTAPQATGSTTGDIETSLSDTPRIVRPEGGGAVMIR